jgi:methylglutaconyl-CoA hydratase
MSGLRVERDGDVLRVTLARPERRNAFDAQLIADLTDAFADVGDVRAVVLAGEGETFCAGADIDWQRSAIDLSYEDNVVAELGVVAGELKAEDRAFLERVALLISPYCLVGWDTGGEAWSP